MGTPLGQDSGSRRPPAISLPSIGSYVDVAVFDEEKAPAYVFGTREQAKTQDGRPKTKDIVSVIVIGGNGTIKTTDAQGAEVTRQVQPDDICTIHFEGQNRWDPDFDKTRDAGQPKSYSGAKSDVGGLQCGDVMRWRFEAEIPGKGAQPRRLRTVQLRRPKPEEAARSARCEELRKGPATPIGVGAQQYGVDEPF